MDIFGFVSLSGLHHKRRSGHVLKGSALLFLLVATLLLNPFPVHATQAESDHLSGAYEAFEAPFGLHNAGNWGVFNIGNSHGNVRHVQDDTHAPISDRIKRDLYYATGIVLTVGTAIHVHALGAHAFLDTGFTYDFVVVGLVGVLIANMWSVKFTGRYLLPSQVFQN